jgi:hypothetical protein
MQNSDQSPPRPPAAVPPSLPQPQFNSTNHEKLHDDKVVEFFKWMVSIAGAVLSVMVGFAAWSSYYSTKEYRDDLKSSMNEIKIDIKDIKSESLITINSTRHEVSSQISKMEDQVKEQIPINVPR